MNKATNFIIGIDIGGSKTIVAVVKGKKIFYKIRFSTPKNQSRLLYQLQKAIQQLIEKAGGPKNIKGVGCGVAGVVDSARGMVLMADNLKILNSLNIKKWLSQKFKYKVKIDNDSRSFMRAEYLFGAGKGYKNIVGMTLGTGIGGGIVINGKIFYGSFNSAGEVGHMIYDQVEFEDLMGAANLKNAGFKNPFGAYQSAQLGNQKAKGIFKKLGQYLGIGLANLVNILDPEAIIVGGGIVGAAKFFIEDTRRVMKKYIISPKSRKNVKILIGRLGENAGAIGAAALFLEK